MNSKLNSKKRAQTISKSSSPAKPNKPNHPSRAILLGPITTPAKLRKILSSIKINKNDTLIGVDDGARHWTQVGKKPNLAIGDWDSLKNKKILKKLSYYTLPTEKNRSDLYYALLAAKAVQAKSIICIGVTGGRMDHHQATLFELANASRLGFKKIEAIDPNARYYFLSKEIPSWNPKMETIIPGQTLSLFALSRSVRGLTLRGLKYPFKGKDFWPSSRGLSNVMNHKNCRISITSGKLLIIIPKCPKCFAKDRP